MIPIPPKLAAAGVTDMVRVTDARMSGTSFGTVFLHVAPEAAVGRPARSGRDGDIVASTSRPADSDSTSRPTSSNAGPRRASRCQPHLRGWPALYQSHVTAGDTGCDLDFLRAPTPAHRRFVEPVVGRS